MISRSIISQRLTTGLVATRTLTTMRAIIILAAIAFTHGAKLERAYLPPSNARTAGGSGNFLQTPVSGISGPSRNYQNTFPQSNDYAGNGFAQSGNDVSYAGNDFARSGNTQNGAEYNNVNYNFGNEGRPERPRAAFERNAAILRQDNSNDGETYAYAYETENGIYAEENAVATNGVEAQGGYSYTGDDGQVYTVRYTADQNGFVPQGDHLPTAPPIPEEILRALEQNARDEAAGIYDDGTYNEAKYGDSNNYNYQQNNAYNENNDDTIVTNSLIRSGNSPYVAPTYIAPNPNVATSTYGTRNVQSARNFNAANPIAPTYGAPNPSYSAPNDQNARNFNAANPIAPTYGAPNPSYSAPNDQNARNFNPASSIAPTYGTPNAPFNRNAPTFNTANAINAQVYNAPNAGISRNSAEKAYLPPFRGQARNAFGRRQQTFNARTGYNY